MGCVSSKLFKKDLRQDIIVNNDGRECLNHVVSLTSSTYGALKLDIKEKHKQQRPEETEEFQEEKELPIKEIEAEIEEPEVINATELMKDLEEGQAVSNHLKRSPKSRASIRGFAEINARSPLKFLNQIGSPRKAKTFGGKENKVKKVSDFSPRPVIKPNNSSENSSKAVLRLSYPVKESPVRPKQESFSPLFDPELVALYEKEISEEEQIKTIISLTPKPRSHLKKMQESESLLSSFKQKCPLGGENAVVIYTTTLRGIRKTFEECNTVRSIIESHDVHLFERDISMDSGLKEELRGLMGAKEVKVPVVFVKGRLIGGADLVVKLEEEGKLGILFHGIARRLEGGCDGCAGIRFVMCLQCNGSCKVLDEQVKKMVKCGECNENGLIQCPICC